MTKTQLAGTAVAFALTLPFLASANALTVSCAGMPSTTGVTWTASPSGGVAPVALMWGNSSTATVQTVAEPAGTYTMTLQATDASATVATTSCGATVATSTTSDGSSVTDKIKALLAQIQALKSQIAQLIAQVAGGTGTGTSTSTPAIGCPAWQHDVKMGDQGDEVKDLQKMLSLDPTIFPPGLITGYFGHKTQNALMHYQKKFGINSTGYFGPRSRAQFVHQCQIGDHNLDGVKDADDENENDNDNEGDQHASSTSMMGGGHMGEKHGGAQNEQENDQ